LDLVRLRTQTEGRVGMAAEKRNLAVTIVVRLEKNGFREGRNHGVCAHAGRFESLIETGVDGVLTLDALPGSYKLRTVALEGVKAKMATHCYRITVP
jgi:hypothetical protein